MTNVLVRPKDDRDFALLGAMNVGRGPIADVAVDRGTIVVTNFADDSLALLDANTLARRGEVFAGQPTGVAVSGDRAFVAVSSASYDAIAVIHTATGSVLREYPQDFTVTAVVVSPDGKRVFAARAGEHGVDVAVIDVATERVAVINVADGADATIDALRLDAHGRRLHVAMSDARSSRVITVDVETGRVRGKVEIGAPIRGLECGQDSTGYVLTSDIADGGVLYVVDFAAHRIVGAANVAQAPTQLVLSVDATRAYVVDYDRVAIVSTHDLTVVGSVSVGARPSAVTVTAERLYVADYDGGVTAHAHAAPTPMLYSQFAATDPLVAPALRQLEPVAV